MKRIKLKPRYSKYLLDDGIRRICISQDEKATVPEGTELFGPENDFDLNFADRLLRTGYFDLVKDKKKRVK